MIHSKHTERYVKEDDLLDTRENILNTAFVMFMERGYADVSLNDILKPIGITKGGFYHYFKSKDELFEEILNSYVIYPLREFERYISNVEGDIFDFLPTFFNSYVYMIDEMVKLVGNKENIYGYYLLIFSSKSKVSNFSSELAQIYRDITSSIESRLKNALEKGIIRNDIEAASYAYHILALCEGLCTVWILDKQKDYQKTYNDCLNNVLKDIK